MFLPNTTGLLTSYTAGTDKFGQAIYDGEAAVVPCAIVKLEPTVQKTPIRSTGSASRGEADELIEPAMILFPSSVQITEGDKFVILGVSLRCISVQPRISIAGNLDHYECTFEAWSQ